MICMGLCMCWTGRHYLCVMKMTPKHVIPRREVVGGKQAVQDTSVVPCFVFSTHEEQGDTVETVVDLLVVEGLVVEGREGLVVEGG